MSRDIEICINCIKYMDGCERINTLKRLNLIWGDSRVIMQTCERFEKRNVMPFIPPEVISINYGK